MAGTYAHFTAATCVYRNADAMDPISKRNRSAIRTHNNFCELGAVSPDYPYLSIGSKRGEFWADTMHHGKTGDLVRAAIPLLAGMDAGDAKQKCTAWLFGYVSHLVADMTVHPIVTLKVGPYEANKTAHRRCEMHQDVYILNKRLRLDINTAEFLDKGIATCIDDGGRLFRPLATLWRRIFAELGVTQEGNVPQPGMWHRSFRFLHDKFAEEGRVLPFSRHFTDKHAIAYPEIEDIDRGYIDALDTPTGTTEHYDSIFDQILSNIRTTWYELDAALENADPGRFTLPNGDLDTGCFDGRSVYWENRA